MNDKFYTRADVAKACIDFVDPAGYDLVIEPSAGSGSFSSQIAGCLAFDIDPEGPGIVAQDWFAYERERDPAIRILVIGNPPFGQQNTLALRFINHAATFADTVAFVLPISFKKYSVQDRIDPHLHRTGELLLAADSFTLEGSAYAVPSVFQVYEWRAERRVKRARQTRSEHLAFVAPAEAQVRIARVGGNAGRASLELRGSVQSNYFIRITAPIEPAAFVALANSIDYPGRDYGVGPRTVSKDELLRALDEAIEDYLREELRAAA